MLRLYDETCRVRKAVEEMCAITVRMVRPDPEEVDCWVEAYGLNGFYRRVELRK